MTIFKGNNLKGIIQQLTMSWQASGLPGRNTLLETADALQAWRSENVVPGLWPIPPRIMGATMDDAWGMGLELILKYAQVLGADTQLSGLRLSWQQIVSACQTYHCDYLGLTVLQFDTEDDLKHLREHLPEHIKIIAGGPVFRFDPELQQRVHIDFVAKDLIEFLSFLLKLS